MSREDPFRLFRSSLERELDGDRQELARVTALADAGGARIDGLRAFAQRIGASTIKQVPGYGQADEAELLHNIHMALQTKAMVAAVKTSSNYVIVTIVLAAIALVSAAASCILAFK